MMKFLRLWALSLLALTLTACVTTKEVRYFQPSETTVINEDGLIPYNIPEYRITKNDMLILNIITTPKGDAAQFYSALNAQTGGNGTGSATVSGGAGSGTGSGNGGNATIYFNGLRVNPQGEIFVFGIGIVKAEGRTLQEVASEIQNRVNENFVQGKSEVRLNTDGITYTILGDVETTQLTGEKVAHKNTLTLSEALAENGGLNRTIDRKNIIIHRKLPEGIKVAHLDLTRADAMNSPYYWVQNGDEILLNTRSKNLNGFGKDPLQTLTTGVSLITTAMSIYVLLTRL